jgi:hypothetical protein
MVDLNTIKNATTTFVTTNAIPLAIGGGVVALGSGLAISSAVRKSRKAKTSKGRARDRKFRSKQKHEQRYKRKRKFKVYKSKNSRAKRRVKYTKNGQPYIILASGKARFIKGKRRAK